MKKNISINIGGIIFHIEEDGYETLKHYLDSINKYFSSYEDSEEIIADIEGRVAEIFLEKLQDGNQVVSAEDVNALIKTMGSISDFEAIEEVDDFEPAPKKEQQKKTTNEPKQSTSGYQKTDKLYRDLQRRVLGGVASGIAHYYNFDPIWIRVGILAVIFGLAFAGPAAAIVFIAYFIMWVVVPGNNHLTENKNLKKLYRDPDQKVIGGVSSGLANYLNIDIMVVRVIFLLLLFGFGTGVLLYVILWMITPEANSLTDKMQMKGEAVTLSNIDTNYKKSKTTDFEPSGEGTFTKVLLFPFRLIGKIFVGLGRAFAPLMLFLVAVIRIVTGVIISTTALSIMVSLLVASGVFLGLYNGDWLIWDSQIAYFPIQIFRNTVPEMGLLFLLGTLFIPVLYLFIAGITIIAKRRVMSPAVGWSILGIWFIAILGAFATLPNVVRDFRDEGIYSVIDDFQIEADTVTLDMNQITYGSFTRRGFRWDSDFFYNDTYTSDFTDLDIKVSNSDQFRVEKRFRARGRNLDEAEKRAQDLSYEYKVEDSTITFDSEMKFSENAEFRAQEADITLFIPEGRPFKINEGMRSILQYFRYGYSWKQAYNNTWVFKNDELVCLTCKSDEEIASSRQSNTQQIDLDEFSVLDLRSSFKVNIIQGDEYKMEVSSTEKFDTPDIRIFNNELSLSRVDFKFNEEETSKTEITITVPQLSRIQVSNKVDLNLENFNSERMIIKAYDNAVLNLNSKFTELELYLTDDARVNLSNDINKLEVVLQKGARLYAYDANVETAEVETDNDSRVRINVNQELNVTAAGFSSISYKGKAQLNIKDKGRSATITKF
ncbi:PspC domain-containing protein [Roseivirga echinicomitans]